MTEVKSSEAKPSTKKWLLIDDVRNLPADIVARTDSAAISALREWAGELEGVIFDNDLGCPIEGWQILDLALEEGILPESVQLVTSNPPALHRMQLALESAGYSRINARFYVK